MPAQKTEHFPPPRLLIIPALYIIHNFTDSCKRIAPHDLENCAFEIRDTGLGWPDKNRGIGRRLIFRRHSRTVDYSEPRDFIGFFFWPSPDTPAG